MFASDAFQNIMWMKNAQQGRVVKIVTIMCLCWWILKTSFMLWAYKCVFIQVIFLFIHKDRKMNA